MGFPSELSGAFFLLASVTDLGTVDQSRTYLGATTDDLTAPDNSQERASANVSSRRRTASSPTHNEVTIDVSSLMVPDGADASALEKMKVVDSTGLEDYAGEHEALQLFIYEQEPPQDEANLPGTYAKGFEFESVEFELNSVTYDGDMAEIDATAFVHGDWSEDNITEGA